MSLCKVSSITLFNYKTSTVNNTGGARLEYRSADISSAIILNDIRKSITIEMYIPQSGID